ncbi:hypothetical protein [Tamlana crocina]|uniref:DUF4412 domain-containing protein n=1 Tax=Tamlana crocina TaxID=393006 RepID=A0ABX1DDG8_9FLAO|nr:hypothetical protein [Tamlana crocina]NJX16397.1 hypothetical protein [Tamlana crocina]
MKAKILITVLLALCFTMPTQAQFLKKLKKKAEQAAERTILRKTDEVVSQKTEKTIDDATTRKDQSENDNSQDTEQTTAVLEPANAALNKNTQAKKDFYKEDVVIKLHENGNLNQTQFFDAEQVAVRSTQDNMPQPSYIDSEGFIYGFQNGEYTKSSIVALQSQGMMMPTMMVEAYKLPPEPVMASLQKQTDLGMTANPFNGIVEFAFIYEPEHFRYEDFKESKQTLRGKTYTKFDFLNEPGYEGSYVLFDDQDRLVEIFTKKSDTGQSASAFDMNMAPPGESLLVYNYQPVTVQLPQAREVRAQGQGLMEGVMNNIVKGGNQPKDDIDEDDYDTSNSKGQVKSVRTALKNHKVKASDLPDSYDFDWQLQTEMVLNTKKKETMDMTFLIKKGAAYQGTNISSRENKNAGNTTMVFDSNLNTMVMFMDAQGSKFLQMFPVPDPGNSSEKIDNYKISDLPSKTIIGYTCKGLQFEDDRYIMKIYHTTEAPITLSNFLNFGNQKKMDFPDIDPRIVKQFSNGLIMEMDMIDKKKSKNNVNIIAKSLNKTATSIKPNQYQTMDLFSGAGMLGN